MPLISAISIGSLSPNAEAIWLAQSGSSAKKVFLVREEDIFISGNPNIYFGQAWRNINQISGVFDNNDLASPFSVAAQQYVINALANDPSIEYIAFDLSSFIGLLLDDNFADESDADPQNHVNAAVLVASSFIYSVRSWIQVNFENRVVKLGVVGLPCISKWITNDNGASYSRISTLNENLLISDLTSKFINPPAGSRWSAVKDILYSAADFIIIDGRDYSSWDVVADHREHDDLVASLRVLSRTVPPPGSAIRETKDLLCMVGDHEFIPPFRRALIPAASKNWKVRSTAGVLGQFRDPPLVQHRSFVFFDFSSVSSVPQFASYQGSSIQTRAGAFGINDPSTFSNWGEFVNNQIKPWYDWGQRRFWLHLPFGSPNAIAGLPESGIKQMDSWIAAKYGQTISGSLINDPMPWLTQDFVGTWHYLTTGQPLSNSKEIADKARHISIESVPFSTFSVADPIEVVAYVGSPMSHISTAHPDAMDRVNAMDPDRFQIFINDCYEPYLWSGMSLAFDKGVFSPQSWPGKSVSTSLLDSSQTCSCTSTQNFPKCYLRDTLQAVWYRWLADLARRHPKRIYIQGMPKKLPVIDGSNPEDPLKYLENDLKNFSFITDDYQFINLTNNYTSATNADIYSRNEFVARKQEVVRYNFDNYIPVERTGLSSAELEFYSLYADSISEIEPPGGFQSIPGGSIRFYKNNNDNSGSGVDAWKIYYLRHVIMKSRIQDGQPIQPLYSSFIDSNKLTVINSILQNSGRAQNIAGFSSWLTSNPSMGSTPPSNSFQSLVFNPKILSFAPSQGRMISDHEQIVDQVLPAIAGCVDGCVLDSISNKRVGSAFSSDIFEDSINYAMQFNSRRIIKIDYFQSLIPEWTISWSGADSVDDKAQVSEMSDENSLTMLSMMSSPLYQNCSCVGAGDGTTPPPPSSSSSSSYSSSSSSSSSSSNNAPPAEFDYGMRMFRFVDADIYGYIIQRVDDLSSIDDKYPSFPYVLGSNLSNCGDFQENFNLIDNVSAWDTNLHGKMFVGGAIGKRPDVEGFTYYPLGSPENEFARAVSSGNNTLISLYDVGDTARRSFVPGIIEESTINKYQWFDFSTNSVKGSNRFSIAAGYGGTTFITKDTKKIDTPRTAYTIDPGSTSALYDVIISNPTIWQLERSNPSLIDSSGEFGVVSSFGNCSSGACINEANSNLEYVYAGENQTIGIRKDGSLVYYGAPSSLANVPVGNNFIKVEVGGESGSNFAIGLTSSGSMVLWGQSPAGTNILSSVPSLASLSVIKDISVGRRHAVALTQDGNVICWGDNSLGQCQVPLNTGPIVKVAAGQYYTMAISSDGGVHVWGNGNLGNPNYLGVENIPLELKNHVGFSVIDISAGESFAMALGDNGRVYCWGRNDFGQCNVPAEIQGLCIGISAGANHALAITFNDSFIYSWGSNSLGQSNVPASVFQSPSQTPYAIAAGYSHSIVLTKGGKKAPIRSMFSNDLDADGIDDVPLENQIKFVSIDQTVDSVLATLDQNGTIRILCTADQTPTGSGSFGQAWNQLVYFDEEWIANGFLTDDTGEPVFIDNRDFVSVCATSGLLGMPEYVWCLHKNGKLYGVELLSARSKATNKYFKRAYTVKRKKFNIENDPNSGRSPNFGKALDFYESDGQQFPNGDGNATVFSRSSNFGGMVFETNGTPKNNGYCKEIAYSLNLIPKINGIRFPVISVMGGYHTAGIVTCVDPTYTGYTPSPDDNFNHPTQMCEIVKLQDIITGSRMMRQTLSRIQRYEAVYNELGQTWTYKVNDTPGKAFDQELYDSVFGVVINSNGVDRLAYVPPRCVSYGRNLQGGGTTASVGGGIVSIMGNNGNYAILSEQACVVPCYFSSSANPDYANELAKYKLNLVGDFTLNSSQFNYSANGRSPIFNASTPRCGTASIFYKFGQNPPGTAPADFADPPFDPEVHFCSNWNQVPSHYGWGNPPLASSDPTYTNIYNIKVNGTSANINGFSYYDYFGNAASGAPNHHLREKNYINNNHIVKVIAYPDTNGAMPILPNGQLNAAYLYNNPNIWNILSICDYEKLDNPFVWIRAVGDSILGVREDGTIDIIGPRADDRDNFVFDPFWGSPWPEGRFDAQGRDFSTLRPVDYQQRIASTRKVGQYSSALNLNAMGRVPVQGAPEVPWYQSSNFALQYQYDAYQFNAWYDRYMFKIPGTQNDCSACMIANSDCSQDHDEASTYFRRSQNLAWMPPGTSCTDGNSTTLAQARSEFINYVNVDGMVRSMSQYNPDWALIFIRGGAEPLWWPTQIPGLSQYALLADDGTGPNAIGLAYDVLQAYVDASHKYKTKLMAYFFPMAWVELSTVDYPLAKNIRGERIQEGRHGNNIDYRSIFRGSSLNYDFINILASAHIELAQRGMNRETGYGVHGAMWDAHPIIYQFDFSDGAKAASGIDTSSNFPWPAVPGSALHNWLFTVASNGNVGSVLLAEVNNAVGFTQAVKEKLEQYMFALRLKEAEFIREIRNRVDAAGYPDFVILPEVVATHSYEYPMICDEGSLYTSGQKLEIGIENFKHRRQPANISLITGPGSMPDFWLGSHMEMLLRQGRAGKRSYAWQIGQWFQPTSTGGECAALYNNKIQAIDDKYGNPSALGFYDGGVGVDYTFGTIPRDIAVRGWLENQSLLALASSNSIEFMYAFYSWYKQSIPENLNNDENVGSSFAVQHMPFIRRIASTLRTIKDSNVRLDERGQLLWCVILHRPQISYKGGTYGPGFSSPYYSYFWQIAGAIHTCVEHGVAKCCVQDVAFKADLFARAAVVVVPFDPSYLPIETKQQLDLFDGLVIYMTMEYGGSTPRLENQFHNTTVDVVTGKTRAQIARDKLWALMNTGPKNLLVQTIVDKPASLPEKPVPLVGYEYGKDSYGNQSIIATIMADVSWHDLRKHTFYWDWNNGPLYSVDGSSCARQNLLYTSPVLLDGNDTFTIVQSMGYRKILDNRWNDTTIDVTYGSCPDGFDRDCYFVEYSSDGIIPLQYLPAQGKLIYYAGYPPVMGNTRSATMTFSSRQKPYRARQLLLETSNGRFNPIDQYIDGQSIDLVPFEQGSIVQVQMIEETDGFPDRGICIDGNSANISSGHDLASVLGVLMSNSTPASSITVQLKCNGLSITRSYKRIEIFNALINDLVGVNLPDYYWIGEYPGSVFSGSDLFPLSFARANSSICGENAFSLGAIIFQNEGVCTIAKRLGIPQLQADAQAIGGNPCSCISGSLLASAEFSSEPDSNYGSNRWQPVIETALFEGTGYADGFFLTIKPQSDVSSPYYNIDAEGMPKSRGIMQYLRSINSNIKTYTNNQKSISDYYDGIIIDFPNAFRHSLGSVHAAYCKNPYDQETDYGGSLNEPRRSIARINGAFIKVMNDIRREFTQMKVSVRGIGSFGDGDKIQTGPKDFSSTVLSRPGLLPRRNLQKRISESYGPIAEACDFIPTPNVSNSSYGVSGIGSFKLSTWIQDAVSGTDSIDIVTMGDSNQCYDGTGWTDGLMHGMIAAGAAMYATPLFPSALVSNSLIGYKCRFSSPGLGSRFIAGTSVSPRIIELETTYGSGFGNLQPAGPDPINPVKLTFAYLSSGSVNGISDVVNGWILDADNPLTIASASQALIFRQQYARKTGVNGSLQLSWYNVSGSAPSTQISISSAFSTQSTTTQYQWTSASFSLSPGARAGAIGAFWRNVNAPVALGWSSIYRATRGAAVSCFDWHNSGSIADIAEDIVQLNDATIVNYIRELRERQIAAGGSGRVAIFINSSFCQYGLCSVDINNWRNNFLQIKNKIENAWIGAGNSVDNIIFVSMVPHQHIDPDTIGTNRNVSYDIAHTENNVVDVNLARILNYSEMTKYYYRDANGNVENLHLSASGYNYISEKIISSLIQYGQGSGIYEPADSPIAKVIAKDIEIDVSNHFMDRNGVRPDFYQAKDRKPIWIASWLRTDTTNSPPFGFANKSVENLGDVNRYAYIKPMIDFSPSGGVSYFDVSASSFISSQRMSNIINKTKQLPSGMRCMHLIRYDASPIWGESGDQLGTGGGLQSPWAENALTRMKNDWTTLAQHLANSNCEVDFLVMDNEQIGCNPDTPQVGWSCVPSGSMSFWGDRPDAHIDAIFNSPKFNQTWYGTPSFNDIFTYGGRYSGHNSSNIKNMSYHPQLIRDYLYYDAGLKAMVSTLFSEAIHKPAQSILGCNNFSNYKDYITRDWDSGYDLNGHPTWSFKVSGNACAPELYAGWGFESAYGISTSDNTRIVRTNYESVLAFPSDAWNHLLILIQKTRAIKRAAPRMPIRPWIASKNFIYGPFYAKWLVDAASEGLYNEKIRHLCLTGVEMFQLWNASDSFSSFTMESNYINLENILSEVNRLMGGWTMDCLTPERVNFTTNYLISGAPTANGNYLWRVTPKPGITLLDASNAVVVVDSDGGKWFTTSTKEAPVFHI